MNSAYNNECGSKQLFDKKFLTVTEAAEFLNLSVGTIYNLVSNKKIPFRKMRKRLYFIPLELYNLIQEGSERR